MATQIDEVAKVYARSLFELARELGGNPGVAAMGEELREVCAIVRADRSVVELFRSPIVDPGQRGASLTRIFKGRVTDTFLNFILVLNRKGRLAQLLSIEDAYDAMEQDAFGRIEVDVFTVSGSIDAATQATLVDDLTRSLGKQPVLHFYADPAMIGGLKLRIGDQLIDGSVAAQLRRMRSTLIDKGLAGRDAGAFLS
jgi:F-type H+-transporting ATPase subunit delta